MDESRELNAVIDVIMLAGTILLKSGSEIHRGTSKEINKVTNKATILQRINQTVKETTKVLEIKRIFVMIS